ncbi:Retrovirus-related Pol polyprotein from transposon TNT 1-94 [Melia azedarach]|uniref:Retrovirus-related Pol polyprotein from transposon TNT 1-94 n=1 Tax=Melia azedarach TaxID=155640 RepID=A0ACC1Z1L5_MELAZ|nr:Retrovirus-related Pol polyprotein from transposon TNT 1-94 [Melia azedarach]
MDFDLALREDCPPPLTNKSTYDDKREKERWEKSNRMCMVIMKRAIPEAFRGTMSDKITTAKDFLADIEKRFVKNEKAEMCTILTNLLSMRLISLSSQFSQFKVSYNCQKETLSLNELISHCIQEEERLKQEKIESAHQSSHPKDKGKRKKKDKDAADTAPQKKQQNKSNDSEGNGCFFYGAEGHKKKQCTNYHAWRAKKESLWGKALKTVAYIFNRVPTKATVKTPYELWTHKKPNLKHLHVWGCPAEARPYRPNEKKLDSRTVSCYFIGYSERSRGYKFYDSRTKSIFELGNARFFEDVELAGGDNVRDFVFEEEYVDIPTGVIGIDHNSIPDLVQDTNQDNVGEPLIQEIVPEEQTLTPQEPIPLKRSTRERRNALSDDYIVFLQEHEVDSGVMEDDPIKFRQAIESSNSQKWIDAMNEEIKSMKDNDEWDLVSLPEGAKPIGCKWIFKTKRDSKADMDRLCFLLTGDAISWKSAKQSIIASSTMAAEFVACFEASNHGVWLQNFVTGLRIVDGIEKPLKLFCDNKSAVLYSNNNRSSTKSKHIDIKFLVVKERVQSRELSIEHIGTNSMVANPFTKGLPPKVFHEHTTLMRVMSFNDIQF